MGHQERVCGIDSHELQALVLSTCHNGFTNSERRTGQRQSYPLKHILEFPTSTPSPHRYLSRLRHYHLPHHCFPPPSSWRP